MGVQIFSNAFIEIEVEENDVSIRVIQEGYTVQRFNEEVMKEIPRLVVTRITALAATLRDVALGFVPIGILAAPVKIAVSNDRMEATATILMTEKEFANYSKKAILALIMKACEEASITCGIDVEYFLNNLKLMEPIPIAKGTLPINGKDAVVRMYEIHAIEPKVEGTGGVDHYEMNVINKANKGDWLGERSEPTPGIPGKTIDGEEIKPQPGVQLPLNYDPNSVVTVFDEKEGITELRATKEGAIVYDGENIMILNMINIDGDVAFATGNIEFDGFVEVSNTVEDNFSVIATENIQILGEMGIGAIGFIESKEGDVYIRGGIAGKGKAFIKAKGNVYTKFASDCTIECGGTLNIGYYAMNCQIKAKDVVVEAAKGKIIGGEVQSEIRIVASEIGSRNGIETKLIVTGFDKKRVEEDYKKLSTVIEVTRRKFEEVDRNLKAWENKVIKKSDYKAYADCREKHIKYKKQIKNLEEASRSYVDYIKVKGNGEVVVLNKAYSGVSIKVEEGNILLSEVSNLPSTYYYNGEELIIL